MCALYRNMTLLAIISFDFAKQIESPCLGNQNRNTYSISPPSPPSLFSLTQTTTKGSREGWGMSGYYREPLHSLTISIVQWFVWVECVYRKSCSLVALDIFTPNQLLSPAHPSPLPPSYRNTRNSTRIYQIAYIDISIQRAHNHRRTDRWVWRYFSESEPNIHSIQFRSHSHYIIGYERIYVTFIDIDIYIYSYTAIIF